MLSDKNRARAAAHVKNFNLGNNGVHIKTIMYLMGHADISTCAKYLHPDAVQGQRPLTQWTLVMQRKWPNKRKRR